MSDPFKQAQSKPSDCPICGKPPTGKFAPFCSVRCADRDLGTWLKGGYVIPATSDEAEAPVEKSCPDAE